MTTYTDEVNIYNAEAVQQGINGAGQTATNYITTVTNDGIMVADANKGASSGSITSNTTGWHLGGVLEFIRNGVSRFWIGLKNQGDTTPTVRIGKAFVNGANDNESQMELDYHSLQLIDKEGQTYFYVSDLRDADGYATVTERFEGDGSTETFRLKFNAAYNKPYTLTIDGVSATPTYIGGEDLRISPAPSDGVLIIIEYTTNAEWIKAYTLGIRASGSDVGGMSVAEGENVIASGNWSHASGAGTTASGQGSHAEGRETTASGEYAHTEGWETTASGVASHAEGYHTTASGADSHAEGSRTTASSDVSHAEGMYSTASGQISHAEGGFTTASGMFSHAEGYYSAASGGYSHAQNYGTKASSNNQTALGKYNIEDANNTYAVIVGNGTDSARSNALAVKWDGSVLQYEKNINRNGTEPSSAIWNYPIDFVDADGDLVGRFYSVRTTGGSQQVGIYAYNGDSSNNNINTGVRLGIDRSSNVSVTLTHPAAWRDALGIGEIVEVDFDSNVSCAASAYTVMSKTVSGSTVNSITLTPGVWHITGCINYSSGAAGGRLVAISTASGTTAPSSAEQRKCTEYVYLSTSYACRLCTQRIVSISANTTYYLKAWQSGVSGGLGATGNICAVRIK